MITIRRATIDDLEAAAAAYVAAWRDGFQHMFSVTTFMRDDFDADRAEEVRELLFDERIVTSVGELDGRVVGFTGVSSNGPVPCLDDLWVHPQAWGTGIAQALLSATDDAHRSLGVHRVTSWVPEDSPRARRLFDKTGWTPTGAIEPFAVYPDEPNRLFEYERALL